FRTDRPWLDHVHELILALDKVRRDFFCFRSGSLYNSSATHAGLIAVNDREDLHTTDITPFKHFFGWADIGQPAAIARSHNHKLEVLRAQRINTARHVARDIHFGIATAHGVQSIGYGLICNAR